MADPGTIIKMAKKLEEITNPCTWKVMVQDENSSTFKQVKDGHKLYNCIECPGTQGSCPNYSSYYRLKENYNERI